MSENVVAIIGGGTSFHVRPHLAISAPAYGGTARYLHSMFNKEERWTSQLYLTKMAGGQQLETNEDISVLIDTLLVSPAVKVVIMTAALCDFTADRILDLQEEGDEAFAFPVGKQHPRLTSRDYNLGGLAVVLSAAEKIISKIRKERKDIFLVGFKTTAGATEDEQFIAGLNLLKTSSCNLVLANDIRTRTNMIITPEQARYSVTKIRSEALCELVNMVNLRSSLNFTRSRVVNAPLVDWNKDDRIPESLRTVVNHCIARGAYKPFNGATVGHFAVKVSDDSFITSIRKTDYNNLSEVGMVFVEAEDDSSEVTAYGAKPSVGGQSQRIIFREHPGMDCIVHAHVPFRDMEHSISTVSQRPYECGSHECGKNTSDGLAQYGEVKAVMLDKHGPNIVFNRDVDPNVVIDFIERHWDLSRSTSE